MRRKEHVHYVGHKETFDQFQFTIYMYCLDMYMYWLDMYMYWLDMYMYVQYMSKIMKQCVNFVCHILIRTHVALLWFASGFVRKAPDTELWHFYQTHRNSANVSHFNG